MKTIKIIDLLNTPLNELPKKIKVEDKTYTLFIDEDTNYHYYQDDECKYFMFSISCFDELNEKVEIIEEDKEDKKIEKVDVNHLQTIRKWKRAKVLGNKINEIIDFINEGRDE